MTEYWVGGYTGPDGGGVRRFAAGRPVVLAAATPDPSFLLASRDHPDLLYAVDEGGDAVVAIRVVGDGGEVVARVGAAGAAPCHLALVAGGRLLLAACYGDGVVSAHRIGADGLPQAGAPLPAPDPAPTGPHPAQDGPHAHCCLEAGGLLLVADLGTDRVLLLRPDGGGFAPDGAIALPPGTGPRDLATGPDGTVLVLGEHDARLHVLDLRRRAVRASVPTTTDPAPGDQAAGLTRTGDRLTVGLRGSDRVAVLRLRADGVPEPVRSLPTGGAWPRHHVADGERLLVANERSGTITAVPLDGGPARVVATAPAPTFLLPIGA